MDGVGRARVEQVLGGCPRYFSVDRKGLNGLAGNVPIFETVLTRAYYYAVSKLCNGIYHNYEDTHK